MGELGLDAFMLVCKNPLWKIFLMISYETQIIWIDWNTGVVQEYLKSPAQNNPEVFCWDSSAQFWNKIILKDCF